MKKVLTAQIAGIKFSIEEDAYQLLFQYIENIKAYYNHSADGLEIASDIESRIAEMITPRLGSSQLVTYILVEEIINTIGSPADFETVESTKPAIDSDTTSKSTKRKLFRDPDQRVIGGVAAGIANYIDIEAWIIRLIWLICIFFWGFGLVLYLMLWAIIPKAKTPVQKLQMKGEPINFKNLISNIDNTFSKKPRNIVEKVLSFLKELFTIVIHKLIKLFSKIIGVVFLLIAILLGLILFGMMNLGTNSFLISSNESQVDMAYLLDVLAYVNQNSFVTNVLFYSFIALMCLVVLIFVVSGLALLGSKIKGLKWILGVSFFLILFLIFANASIIANTIADFTQDGKYILKVPIDNSTQKHKLVSINHKYNKNTYPKTILELGNFGLEIYDTGLVINNIHIIIKPTDETDFYVNYIATSKGATREQAFELSQKINYNFQVMNGDILIENAFLVKKGLPWRAQELYLEINVPQNVELFIDQSLESHVLSVETEDFEYNDYNIINNTIINKNGKINCVTCHYGRNKSYYP